MRGYQERLEAALKYFEAEFLDKVRTIRMGRMRDFSYHEGHLPPARNVEDAPAAMRQELLDAISLVASQTKGRMDVEGDLYFVISQNLGVLAAANPMGGRRQRIGRDIGNADWPRVYDLVVRLWPEFLHVGFHEVYREEVNRVFAAHGVAWDLGDDGRLHRVLPGAVQAQINRAFMELREPQYAAALALFEAAREAYDHRPQRLRDACSNIFDAMESVAKQKHGMPNATFGKVVADTRQRRALSEDIIRLLEAMNTLRNRNFGHGMATPFNLTPAEVDFAYLASIGAILLLVRTQ
jgi:hypothetical protein